MRAKRYNHLIGKFAYLPYYDMINPIGQISEIVHLLGEDLYLARMKDKNIAFNVEILCDVNGRPFYPERRTRDIKRLEHKK